MNTNKQPSSHVYTARSCDKKEMRRRNCGLTISLSSIIHIKVSLRCEDLILVMMIISVIIFAPVHYPCTAPPVDPTVVIMQVIIFAQHHQKTSMVIMMQVIIFAQHHQ